MDKIIVVSNHAKDVFYNTRYTAKDENGEILQELFIDKGAPRHPDIVTVNYPFKDTESVKLNY